MNLPKRIGIAPLDLERAMVKMLVDDLAYVATISERHKALAATMKMHLDVTRRLSLVKSKKIEALEAEIKKLKAHE